jgi:quercetin dioxygenase-like cupin family protein
LPEGTLVLASCGLDGECREGSVGDPSKPSAGGRCFASFATGIFFLVECSARNRCYEQAPDHHTYEDKAKGEMTCLLKWEPGATLPMHKHPEIEQTYVIEGSFYDHDGICRAGEFVWRRVGSFHETHSDEGAVILAVYRKPNVFQHSTGYARV